MALKEHKQGTGRRRCKVGLKDPEVFVLSIVPLQEMGVKSTGSWFRLFGDFRAILPGAPIRAAGSAPLRQMPSKSEHGCT